MSLGRKLAVVSGIVWLVIGIGYVWLLAQVGVEGFAAPEGESTRDLIAAVIVPGYLINFAIIWWTRRGRQAGEIDERDKMIERRATEITAMLTLLTVFLVSIWLYDSNLEAGSVPVGWLFIMAYGTIVWVSFLHPVARLVLDVAGGIDA